LSKKTIASGIVAPGKKEIKSMKNRELPETGKAKLLKIKLKVLRPRVYVNYPTP